VFKQSVCRCVVEGGRGVCEMKCDGVRENCEKVPPPPRLADGGGAAPHTNPMRAPDTTVLCLAPSSDTVSKILFSIFADTLEPTSRIGTDRIRATYVPHTTVVRPKYTVGK
jgi:hypothetical protein